MELTTARLTIVGGVVVLAITALVATVCRPPHTIHSFGNKRTERVCARHGQPVFCWAPPRFNATPNGPTYAAFWEAHGPEIEPMPGGTSRVPPGINYSVVHLRCGDILAGTPSRNSVYHLPSQACLAGHLGWLDRHRHTIFLAGGHTANTPQDKIDRAVRRCKRLVTHYTATLAAYGITAHVLPEGSQRDDWATLHGAQQVLALVPSSFVMTTQAHALTHLHMLTTHDVNASWWARC